MNQIVKILFWGSLMSASICAAATVAVPARRSPQSYSSLWSKSPFTIAPVTSESDNKGIVENSFNDWALSGVIEYPNRKLVILQNVKKNERLIIDTLNSTVPNFVVLEVQNGESYLDTQVRMKIEGKEGWVRYDKRYLNVKGGAPDNSNKQANPTNPSRQPGTSRMNPPQRSGKKR